MVIVTKAELESRIMELSSRVEYLEKQLDLKEKEISGLRNRGAGCTPKFSDREREKIVQDYKSGKSIRAVAGLNKCSVGYVHKLISEHNKKEMEG